jgi:hypothetical protein
MTAHLPENLDWCIECDNRNDLERIIKSVKEIGMPNFTMVIFRTDEFTGMRAEVRQSGMVCLLRAQLECAVDVRMGEDTRNVTVSCEQLLGVLRGSGKPQFRVRLFQTKGDTNLTVQSFDEFDSTFTSQTRLATFMEEEEELLELDEMSFSYLLRMDMNFFKSIVKNNIDLGCEQIEITIFRPERPDEEPPAKKQNTGANIFRIRFRCATDNIEDVKEIVSVATDQDGRNEIELGDVKAPELTLCKHEMVQQFTLLFDLKFMCSFLKSVDQRGKLKVFLNEETPLLFKIDLPTENSYIYFVQAPQVSDN